MKLLILMFTVAFPIMVSAQRWQSKKVTINNGRLTYNSDQNQNRIPDYSHAGYKGGGVPIPDVPVVITLNPENGDQTAVIQDAIDRIAALAPDANGIRGAVLLQAGKYRVDGTLIIKQDGIVVKGVGDDKNPASNTILYRDDPGIDLNFFDIGTGISPGSSSNKVIGSETDITSNFVQAGSYSFDVADASAYNIGDHIIVYHPDSDDWLAALDYGAVGTHADAEPWSPGQTEAYYNRYIKGINGNTITIDAPVFMHLDKSLSQSYIYKINPNLTIANHNIGIEKLRVEIATNGEYTAGHCSIIMKFNGVENFWIDQVTGVHFSFSLIKCISAIRGTIMNCQAIKPHNASGGMCYNYQISDRAQLLLLKNNFSSYGTVDFTNGGSGRFSAANNGNVYLNNVVWRSRGSSFDNHVRWYTGNLFDCNKNIESSGERSIMLGNRGHWTNCGWGAAFCTAWNYDGGNKELNVQGVPTGQNFAIGCHGPALGNFKRRSFFTDAPDAYYEGFNTAGIFPSSLYLAQLRQRLDPDNYLDLESPEDIHSQGINIFNAGYSMNINESENLFAAVYPADASDKSVTWSSTNPNIATVSNGLVTAKSGGSAFIIATSGDNSVSDSVEVSVRHPTNVVVIPETEAIQVFPNPATHWLTIKGLQKLNRIEIVDITGIVVFQKTVNEETDQVDISGLVPGIYMVRFVHSNQNKIFMKL